MYHETAAQGEGHGVLTVRGDAAPYTTNTVTHIPIAGATAAETESLNYVTLVATNYANVVLTSDLTLGDLFLPDDNAKLYLKGHTLKLKAAYHKNWGTEERVVYDGGQILWARPSTVLMLR